MVGGQPIHLISFGAGKVQRFTGRFGMLGASANHLDLNVAKCLRHVEPTSILEYGCGGGKLGRLCQQLGLKLESLHAVQKLFQPEDMALLQGAGYNNIYDEDIYEFVRRGIPNQYSLIVALDVIEHFMHAEAMSIIDYSLYRCSYMLLVWPSHYPQQTDNVYETHRTSFELRDIANRFDVVYYSQTGFIEVSAAYRYHIALLRGHMNFSVKPAIA